MWVRCDGAPSKTPEGSFSWSQGLHKPRAETHPLPQAAIDMGASPRRLRSAIRWARGVDGNARLVPLRYGKVPASTTAEETMRVTVLEIVLVSVVCSSACWAQSAPSDPPGPSGEARMPSPALKQARAKMRAACASDLQKFCADVERGKGARQACLRSHRKELSPECTSARLGLRVTRRQEKAVDK
jgi:hypothetical protein